MLRKFFEEEFPLQNFFREAKCIKKCTLQFISLLKFSSCARKKKSRFKKMQHDAKKVLQLLESQKSESLTFFFSRLNCCLIFVCNSLEIEKKRI